MTLVEKYIDLEREKIRIFGIEETIDFQPTNIEKQGWINSVPFIGLFETLFR